MQIIRYEQPVTQVPVDFLADPDGFGDYVSLVTAAGFDPDATPSPVVGALTEPWQSHPEGAAVVARSSEDGGGFTVVEIDSGLARAA